MTTPLYARIEFFFWHLGAAGREFVEAFKALFGDPWHEQMRTPFDVPGQ